MKVDYREAMKELGEKLKSFDLPAHRKAPHNNDCLRWLSKHLNSRNANHSQMPRVSELMADLGYPIQN